MLSLICRASRVRTCATIAGMARAAAARLLDALQDGRQVADRHPLGQQRLQHALHAAHRDLRRDHVGHQLLLLARQLIQQLLRLGVGQQLRNVLRARSRSGAWSARSADRPRCSRGTAPLPSATDRSTCAGRPNAGSLVRSPGRSGTPPFGSIASSMVGRNSPRPASISLTRIT